MGDDDNILTVDKIRENFMVRFTGQCLENLLARPFFWLGGRMRPLTQTSEGFRLIIDLEQPESVVRVTPVNPARASSLARTAKKVDNADELVPHTHCNVTV